MPVYHLSHRQLLWIRPYDERGRLRAAALRRFSWLLRCAHTGKARPIHWRVLVILYDAWLHFGQPQVTVLSGHRPPEVARLKTSRHVTGHAVDFALDGVSNRRLRDYLLRTWDRVGVGYYPRGYHVHLDVRPKKRFWVDLAGVGEAARYAGDPWQVVRRERRRPRGRNRRENAGAGGQSRSPSKP